jgi:hypothetical protein
MVVRSRKLPMYDHRGLAREAAARSDEEVGVK